MLPSLGSMKVLVVDFNVDGTRGGCNAENGRHVTRVRHDGDGNGAGRGLEVEKVIQWVVAGDGMGCFMLMILPTWH